MHSNDILFVKLAKIRSKEALMEKIKTRKSTLMILIFIFLLALYLRGLYFMYAKGDMALNYDPRNYWLMSHQLVDEGIYGYWYEGNPFGGQAHVSNARVMPGYPVFLASVYKVIGDKYLQITVVRLIQIMAGSLSVLLAFYFVRKVFKKDWMALLTAFFMAVYPTYVFMPMRILTEVLALFTMLLYFCIAVHAFESKKAVTNLVAGAAFGLHILIRPTLLPLFILPFIFILLSKNRPNIGTLVRVFILQLTGFVVVMAPWWIRNIVTLGSLIITAKASGNPFLAGTYPYFQDYFLDVTDDIRGVNDKQMALGIQRLMNGLKTDPWLYIKWFIFGKTVHTFETPFLYNLLKSTETVHYITHFFILAAGIPGMILHAIRSIKAFWFYLYGLAFLALQNMFIPDPRFAYQLFFFVMVGAAHLLVSLFGLFGRKNKQVKVRGSV